MASLHPDPYLQPNGVLINKLGITDAEQLAELEYRLTVSKQKRLILNNYILPTGEKIRGQYFGEVMALHRYLFGEIYDWAGKFRTVDMRKENSFLEAAFLPTAVHQIQLRFDDVTAAPSGNLNAVSTAIGKAISDFNFMHPFREGNGRTQRILASAMAVQKGFAFELLPGTDMYSEYMAASKLDDYAAMITVFRKHLLLQSSE